MRAYLLDTNHVSHAIRVVSPIRDRLRRARRQGFRLLTCWEVLCELQEGIVFAADPARLRRSLRILLKDVRIWPLDESLVEQYGWIAKTAVERGRALSMTDMILASFAVRNQVKLLTTDRDFEAFPEVATENWVAE
jgi:predicted nucleic acid-binding protein